MQRSRVAGIHEYGITPMQKKTDAIVSLQHPKTFKQLKSFMGSIHHLNKFIPNLAHVLPTYDLYSQQPTIFFLYGKSKMKKLS